MTDDIDVTNGGAIAVDTASLERAAAGIDAVADDLDALADRIGHVGELLQSAAAASGGAGVHRASRAAASLGGCTGRARLTSAQLREAARVYEIVELTNERDLAAAAGDAPRQQTAAVQLARARAADPAAAHRADDALADARRAWAADTAGDLRDPLLLHDPMGAWLLGVLAPLALVARGGGLVRRGHSPSGPAPAVELTAFPSSRRTPVVAPASIAAMVARVPDGRPAGRDAAGAARVRVERYELPDGSREFAVYVAGTQAPLESGGDEPWDSMSNAQLYAGGESASYEAVRAALEAAGARPGDGLDLVGFSQGAMVAAWLAQDTGYDVRSLIDAGSPVQVDLPGGVAHLSLEHRDDPVLALAGPWDGGVEAADTVVVTREVDPAPGVQDLLLPAHDLREYTETAHLFEASGDPRVTPFRETIARLATATTVTVTEYGAVRVR